MKDPHSSRKGSSAAPQDTLHVVGAPGHSASIDWVLSHSTSSVLQSGLPTGGDTPLGYKVRRSAGGVSRNDEFIEAPKHKLKMNAQMPRGVKPNLPTGQVSRKLSAVGPAVLL